MSIIEFVVDSGASISIIEPGVCGSKIRPTATSSVTASGHIMEYIGEQDVRFPVNGIRHRFRVRYLPIKADGILGTDFFAATGVTIDFGRGEMKLFKGPALGRDKMDRRGWVSKLEVNHITQKRTPPQVHMYDNKRSAKG
jgi:hypothetical protein